MKKIYISFVLLVATISVFAQTPTISMTTTLSINSQITIGLSGNTSSTPIQIDWGNGVKENFTIGSTMEFFGYPVKGSTIKIWGAGITGLNIQSKNITALEFFDATLLESLFCKNNQITTLNLSGCSALEFVECKQNLISNLTLPSTTTLTYVDCSDNNLTLSTLPIKQATWTDYIYSPQKAYKFSKNVFSINEEIDLSSQLTINSNTTTYTWKTKGGTTLVNGTDYSSNNGKYTFLKTNTDSVYCEMTNIIFPDFTLCTNKTLILYPPSIIMTTATTVGSTFSFDISARVSDAPIKIDWGNGTLTDYIIGTSIISVSSTLMGNTIKIYETELSYLNVENKKLTSLDVTNNDALNSFTCSNNQLTALDVSKNSYLTYLDCSSNKLIALDISKNSSLMFLSCSNNLLTNLDVSKNTVLVNVSCGSNQLTDLEVSNKIQLIKLSCSSNQLNTLVISNNPKLDELSCSSNKLTTLDVSQNTALIKLYCYSNQLTALDVSKNTALSELSCSINQLTNLDVSVNTSLISLNCSSNQLTTLDISKNTALIILSCHTNQLSTLDVSKNNTLTSFWCYNNQFTFHTLPGRQSTWSTFSYSPQAILKLPKNKYALGEEIDLSNQLTSGANAIVFRWKTAGNVTLVKDVDYTENNGKFTFIKRQGDYLFCQVTNASFPDLTLTTENITTLSTEPAITMTTTTNIGSTFSFNIAATINNNTIQVDWGNGSLTDYTIGTSISNISNTLTGNNLKIYGLGISNIDLSSKKLTAVNVFSANSIKNLNCRSNYLTFNALPIKQTTWATYIYSPQSKMVLQKKNYSISESIALSSQLTINGNTTNFTWKTKGETTLTSGTDYSTTNGVTTFLKAQTDSVYCQMTNATFPSLTLSTTNIKVTDPTSVDNDLEQITKVYPNPISNQLWVESEEMIKKVEIYTIVGTKVFEQDYNTCQKANINAAEFPKGLLIIKIYGVSSVMEKKILKE